MVPSQGGKGFRGFRDPGLARLGCRGVGFRVQALRLEISSHRSHFGPSSGDGRTMVELPGILNSKSQNSYMPKP